MNDYYEQERVREQRRKEWLAALKPGDEVAIRYSSTGSMRYEFQRVERRTATQFVTSNSRRYRTDDGRRVGDHYGPKLVEPTAELKQEIADEQEQRKLVARLEGVRWRNLDLAQLRVVAAALPKENDNGSH